MKLKAINRKSGEVIASIEMPDGIPIDRLKTIEEKFRAQFDIKKVGLVIQL